MPKKIYYWQGIFDNNKHELQEYKEVLEKLRTGEQHGLYFEPVRGCRNLYKLRDSKKCRLLFTFIEINGQRNLLFLKDDPNHKYDSAFRDERVLNRHIEKNREGLEQELLTWEAVQDCLKQEEEGEEGNYEFVPVQYGHQQYFVFNQKQQEATQRKLPLQITGGPGSGKTSIFLAMWRQIMAQSFFDAELKLAYIAPRKPLADEVQRLWEALPESKMNAKIKIVFTTYLEAANLDRLDRFSLGEEKFSEWFDDHLKDPKNKPKKLTFKGKAEAVYQECRILSAYSEDQYLNLDERETRFKSPELRKLIWQIYQTYNDYFVGKEKFYKWFNDEYLKDAKNKQKKLVFKGKEEAIYQEFRLLSAYSENQYLSLGERETGFKLLEQRQWIWQIYQTYNDYLKSEQWVDIAFTKLNQQNAYDMVFVDEAHSFSRLQLAQLNLLAKAIVNPNAKKNARKKGKNGTAKQVCYLVDTHQNTDDSCSVRPFILTLTNNAELSLDEIYRPPGLMIRLANEVLRLKDSLTLGLADKKDISSFSINKEQEKKQGRVEWIESLDNKETLEVLRERASRTDFAVVTLEHLKQEVIALLGTNNVFNIDEFKGLGFNSVFIYRLLDPSWISTARALKAAGPSTSTKPHKHRPKRGQGDRSFAPAFGSYYIALTRTTFELFIYESNNPAFAPFLDPLKKICKESEQAQAVVTPAMSEAEKRQAWSNHADNLDREGLTEQARAIREQHGLTSTTTSSTQAPSTIAQAIAREEKLHALSTPLGEAQVKQISPMNSGKQTKKLNPRTQKLLTTLFTHFSVKNLNALFQQNDFDLLLNNVPDTRYNYIGKLLAQDYVKQLINYLRKTPALIKKLTAKSLLTSFLINSSSDSTKSYRMFLLYQLIELDPSFLELINKHKPELIESISAKNLSDPIIGKPQLENTSLLYLLCRGRSYTSLTILLDKNPKSIHEIPHAAWVRAVGEKNKDPGYCPWDWLITDEKNSAQLRERLAKELPALLQISLSPQIKNLKLIKDIKLLENSSAKGEFYAMFETREKLELFAKNLKEENYHELVSEKNSNYYFKITEDLYIYLGTLFNKKLVEDLDENFNVENLKKLFLNSRALDHAFFGKLLDDKTTCLASKLITVGRLKIFMDFFKSNLETLIRRPLPFTIFIQPIELAGSPYQPMPLLYWLYHVDCEFLKKEITRYSFFLTRLFTKTALCTPLRAVNPQDVGSRENDTLLNRLVEDNDLTIIKNLLKESEKIKKIPAQTWYKLLGSENSKSTSPLIKAIFDSDNYGNALILLLVKNDPDFFINIPLVDLLARPIQGRYADYNLLLGLSASHAGLQQIERLHVSGQFGQGISGAELCYKITWISKINNFSLLCQFAFLGGKILLSLITDKPEICKEITGEALCRLAKRPQDKNGLVSALFYLATTDIGIKVLKALFTKNPAIMQDITINALLQRGVHNQAATNALKLLRESPEGQELLRMLFTANLWLKDKMMAKDKYTNIINKIYSNSNRLAPDSFFKPVEVKESSQGVEPPGLQS